MDEEVGCSERKQPSHGLKVLCQLRRQRVIMISLPALQSECLPPLQGLLGTRMNKVMEADTLQKLTEIQIYFQCQSNDVYFLLHAPIPNESIV